MEVSAAVALESLVKGLNPEQHEAVTQRYQGHILVLAGAGCGKTSVLTRRVAFLASTGTVQNRILALTFTRKASAEMASRVKALECIDPLMAMPVITTFHGFSLGILQEHIDGKRNFSRLDYESEPRLISQEQRLGLLAAISTSAQRLLLGTDLSGLDSLLAQRAVFPEKLSGHDFDKRTMLAEIGDALVKQKNRLGYWDFSDLISGALQLFSRYPEIASLYRERFSAILVDEFQDTNPMQICLLREFLKQSGSTLFAVGDDDQAIYGFRGADIGPITTFETSFEGARIIKLQTNYRSMPSVLRTANRIFADKPERYRKILRSGKYDDSRPGPGPRPSRYRFQSPEKMAGWIVEKACEIRDREKVAVSEMAALFRINQSIEWIEKHWAKSSAQEHPRLMTIHGSKGLEFPVVFLCDLEESIFPSYRSPRKTTIATWTDLFRYLFCHESVSPSCDWDEEKRLFYVGVTRAQKHLFFLSTTIRYVYGRKKQFEPSRFLKLV